MDFTEYSKLAAMTRITPTTLPPEVMWVLGIAGEAGELVEKVKKLHRDREKLTDKDYAAFVWAATKEAGDILWYLDAFLDSIGVPLQTAATTNINKLHKRLQENKIHGSGDNR